MITIHNPGLRYLQHRCEYKEGHGRAVTAATQQGQRYWAHGSGRKQDGRAAGV